MNRIYLDNAATTPVAEEVLDRDVALPEGHYGNASSIYATGRDARQAVDLARRHVAGLIGAKPGKSISPAAARKAITGR